MILGYKKLGYKKLVCCFSQIDFSVKMIVKVDIFFIWPIFLEMLVEQNKMLHFVKSAFLPNRLE